MNLPRLNDELPEIHDSKNTLARLNAQLAEVRAEQSKRASRMGDIAAEEFELNETARDLQAAVDRADADLVDALADAEMGLPVDVPAARQRLADARLLAKSGIESSQRLSVLSVLRQRLEAEHQTLHGQGLSLIERIRQAEVEALRARASEIRNDAESAMEVVARSEGLLGAIIAEMRERGAAYDLPQLNEGAVTYRSRLSPNEARRQILAELAA